MVFRCNNCVKVFSTRSELHQHQEVDHGRVKLVEMQGGKFPCPRCSREFLSEIMLVNHSRDHKENVYGCNECPWHFNTVAGLIKHCQDTHDDRHFACTTCKVELYSSDKQENQENPGKSITMATTRYTGSQAKGPKRNRT